MQEVESRRSACHDEDCRRIDFAARRQGGDCGETLSDPFARRLAAHGLGHFHATDHNMTRISRVLQVTVTSNQHGALFHAPVMFSPGVERDLTNLYD